MSNSYVIDGFRSNLKAICNLATQGMFWEECLWCDVQWSQQVCLQR